jgi:hypothetical protein
MQNYIDAALTAKRTIREQADEIERLRAIKASREDVLGEKIGEIVKLRGLLDKAVRLAFARTFTTTTATTILLGPKMTKTPLIPLPTILRRLSNYSRRSQATNRQ